MEEIKRLREALGWSQQRLADEAGVDRATINQVEGGRRSPTIETLKSLARAMGAEVGDFFPKGQAPLPDFDIQERRDASFGDAIIAATDSWKRAASKPNAGPAKIIGIAGTILDLHDAISTPLDNEPAWESLTSTERREVIDVLEKLNEAAAHVLDHAGETAEVAQLEERVKQRRADMRERTREISA